MYYASASYMTGECIVAAFSLLEQTTSTTVQLEAMLSTLKETILMDHDTPMIVGEYYVSRYDKIEVLLKHLKKFMQEEGRRDGRKAVGGGRGRALRRRPAEHQVREAQWHREVHVRHLRFVVDTMPQSM